MLLTLTQSLWLTIIGLGFVTIGMFSVQSVAPIYLGGALGTLVPALTWEYAGFSGLALFGVGCFGEFWVLVQYHKESKDYKLRESFKVISLGL